MPNYNDYSDGNHALVTMNFMLRVEAKYDLPCKSVHSLQEEKEYEYIKEGGLNNYVHIREKPISKPFTLEVERYVGTDYFDPLPQGALLKLPVVLMASERGGEFKSPSVEFTFHGCTVTGKKYSEMDAEKSGLLVETTTIAYQQLEVVNYRK